MRPRIIRHYASVYDDDENDNIIVQSSSFNSNTSTRRPSSSGSQPDDNGTARPSLDASELHTPMQEQSWMDEDTPTLNTSRLRVRINIKAVGCIAYY